MSMRRFSLRWWITNALRALTLVVILFPLLYALSVSFMGPDEVYSNPPRLLPKTLSLTNYQDALRTVLIARFLLNSLIVSTGITLGQLVVCSMAAFAFAYFEFPGKKFIFMAILATMMIPGESIIISNYMTIGSLRWYDTYQALIVPGMASALAVFFLRQSFLSMPRELYEVARMDGCGNFRFLMTLLLPLSKGALGALGIYVFIGAWNQYLWPLLVTNKAEMRTVQIGIGMLKSSEFLSMGLIMAGIAMILLPSVAIFFLGQRQILSGTLAGAIKG